VQSMKAVAVIEVTLFGITMDLRFR